MIRANSLGRKTSNSAINTDSKIAKKKAETFKFQSYSKVEKLFFKINFLT